MKLYLLNALVTPFKAKKGEVATFIMQLMEKEELIQTIRLIEREDAEIVSAFGHQDTVTFMKEILPEDVARFFVYNRKDIYFEEGDLALVFRVTDRGQNLKEHNLEDLRRFYASDSFEFIFISRVFAPSLALNPYFKKQEK
jgi:hypothetical protein